ncbi:MAG: hypothetical protein J7M18_03030, partial [Candidatus Eremiobacteraeota bacterium]|nr:hypothetical protein [Candidatus Eremiobacteraeota bacterium]
LYLFECREGMGAYKEAEKALKAIHAVSRQRIKLAQEMKTEIPIFGMLIGVLERTGWHLMEQNIDVRNGPYAEHLRDMCKIISTGDFSLANKKLNAIARDYHHVCKNRKPVVLEPEFIPLENAMKDIEEKSEIFGPDSVEMIPLYYQGSFSALQEQNLEESGRLYSHLYRILKKNNMALNPVWARHRNILEGVQRARLSAMEDKKLKAWYEKNKNSLEEYQKIPAMLAMGDMYFRNGSPLGAAKWYGKALNKRISGLTVPLDPSIYLLAGQVIHAYLAHDYNPENAWNFVLDLVDKKNRNSSIYHIISRVLYGDGADQLAKKAARKSLKISEKNKANYPLEYARDLYWLGFITADENPGEARKLCLKSSEILSTLPENRDNRQELVLKFRNLALQLRLAFKRGDRKEVRRLVPIISSEMDKHYDEAHWAVWHMLGYCLPEAEESTAPGGDKVLKDQILAIWRYLESAQNEASIKATKKLLQLYEKRYPFQK